jgi:hypothetical protein
MQQSMGLCGIRVTKISSSLKQQAKVFFKNIESLSEPGFGEI